MSHPNERHFETHSALELYVENGKGKVSVTAADTTESHVLVTGQDADDVTIEFSDNRLSVIAPKSRGAFLSGEHRLDMDITIPTGSSLSAKLGSSDLDVGGELAEVTVKSGSGDVRIDTMTGDARIETGSGDVRVGSVDGDLQVKSGSGDVEVQQTGGEVSVSTGSGDVSLEASEGTVVVKTGSGDLKVGRSDGDVTLSTGSGDLTVEHAARGRITMKGASGDVRVGVPAGLPVWTDISTVSGRIRSSVQGNGQPQDGADHLELRARTVSGDVTLVES